MPYSICAFLLNSAFTFASFTLTTSTLSLPYALPIYHQANRAPFLHFLFHMGKFTYRPLLKLPMCFFHLDPIPSNCFSCLWLLSYGNYFYSGEKSCLSLLQQCMDLMLLLPTITAGKQVPQSYKQQTPSIPCVTSGCCFRLLSVVFKELYIRHAHS